MKTSQFVGMTTAELQEKLVSLKAELFNLRFSHTTGSLTNPVALRVCKRDIAKVKTILRERELNIAKTAPVEVAPAKKTTKKAKQG